MAAATIAIVCVCIIVFIVALVLYKGVFVVHQAEGARWAAARRSCLRSHAPSPLPARAAGIVVERLGRYDRVLKPGINFVVRGTFVAVVFCSVPLIMRSCVEQVPFLEAPRTFTWRKTYIDANSRIRDTTTTHYRIDLRESVFNFLRQEVYTKDTVLVDVNALMYYSISDVRKVSVGAWSPLSGHKPMAELVACQGLASRCVGTHVMVAPSRHALWNRGAGHLRSGGPTNRHQQRRADAAEGSVWWHELYACAGITRDHQQSHAAVLRENLRQVGHPRAPH